MLLSNWVSPWVSPDYRGCIKLLKFYFSTVNLSFKTAGSQAKPRRVEGELFFLPCNRNFLFISHSSALTFFSLDIPFLTYKVQSNEQHSLTFLDVKDKIINPYSSPRIYRKLHLGRHVLNAVWESYSKDLLFICSFSSIGILGIPKLGPFEFDSRKLCDPICPGYSKKVIATK